MGITEKLAELEHEYNRTQKNKATEYHLGILRSKIAKLRAQLLEPTTKGGKPGEGFDPGKKGNARVVMIGFPSVGKSSLLSKCTKTESVAAEYAFTTLTAIPGVLEYGGAEIQLLDLPGIIEGAAQGKGRGRQVVAVAKTADLILIVLDATKPDKQRELLEKELDAVGIRLNKSPPGVTIKRKTTGGIVISKQQGVVLKNIDEKMIRAILAGYKMHNCDVLLKEDITVDEFIDAVLGNRKYIRALYIINKVDAISMEQMDRLARHPHSIVISCQADLNLEYMKERIWNEMGLVRVYTRKRNQHPDLDDPVVVRQGGTVEDVCNSIHKSLVEKFAYAMVWGRSSKFEKGQKVGLAHVLSDEDVVSLYLR